jgi:hypothetical protein
LLQWLNGSTGSVIPLADKLGLQETVAMSEKLTRKDALDLYENGKHRRYNLLFSVNGGAFAIAKLLTGEPGKPGIVLGALTLPELSAGMALFTAVMVADIYSFGYKMRKNNLPEAFDWRGKAVLLLLGVLVVAGWLLAGFGEL